MPAADQGKSGEVQSVTRALDLLEALNRQKVASVKQLHETTGLPKPTIVRLLKTLTARGYVANDHRQGGYSVTSLVRALSCGFHGDPMVVEAGRAWAIDLTRRLKWPVAIAVLDEDAVTVRFSTIADSPISPFQGTVGRRLSLVSRGLGRAYLAFCPAAERSILLRILASSKDPENAPAHQPAALLRQLKAMRGQGYAERDPTVEPRSSCTLAVPVMDGDRVLATLGLTYFTSAMKRTQAVDLYVPHLRVAAENIARSISRLDGRQDVDPVS
ncbi:DNA-binding transcriptional regulator [Azospirillum sp. ST 5-10]|uniref:DNA-binding transcriptional regulator n=1 Tax=unclassified Azospirillum TaxID=2630922 RepID=UPI003F4A76EF